MMEKWNSTVGTNELILCRDQEEDYLYNFDGAALPPEQAFADSRGFHAHSYVITVLESHSIMGLTIPYFLTFLSLLCLPQRGS